MDSLTTFRAGAYLHHLHLSSPEPQRLASFYGSIMDMTVREQDPKTWICRGPSRIVLISEGNPRSLKYGAYACRDRSRLSELRAQAEQQGLDVRPFSSSLLAEGSFSVRDPDGNSIVFGFSEDGPSSGTGWSARLQHLALRTKCVAALEEHYAKKLGFALSDRIIAAGGELKTCFMRSDNEHHTLACFYRAEEAGHDHHSYETKDWTMLRDWCDRIAEYKVPILWGPGRHGPGNNIFIMLEDLDGNWIEISTEIELIYNRPTKEWSDEERTFNLWGQAGVRIEM